jgi:hypothetical protein
MDFMSDEQLINYMGAPVPTDPKQLDYYCEVAWYRIVAERGVAWERPAALLAGVCAPLLWDWLRREAARNSQGLQHDGRECGGLSL